MSQLDPEAAKVNLILKQLYDDYAAVFNESPPAQRVLQDLLGRFHFTGSTLSLGTDRDAVVDPYDTIHQEGQRDVILHILQMLRMNSLEYVNMARTSLPSDLDAGE